jgi:short-subunit dehydrogenase
MAAQPRPTALITGASSGIGREFAILLAQKNYNLFLVALENDLLERLAIELTHDYGVQIHTLATDLATPDAAIQIYQKTQRLQLPISMLINNAGVGSSGLFCHTPLRQHQITMGVNIIALTELTKLFAPHMVQQGHGHILNMASTAAFQPGPGMAVYFASKAYILSFSQALTEELRGTGVSVTVLCPGPTRTEFAKHANLQNNPVHNGIVPLWEPKAVAAFGYKTMMTGKRMATVGFINTCCSILARTAPQGMVMRYIKKLHLQ